LWLSPPNHQGAPGSIPAPNPNEPPDIEGNEMQKIKSIEVGDREFSEAESAEALRYLSENPDEDLTVYMANGDYTCARVFMQLHSRVAPTISDIEMVYHPETNGPALWFEINGYRCFEHLRESAGTFEIDPTDSDLATMPFSTRQIDGIREKLRAWLAGTVHISVTLNGVEDFCSFTVPANAGADFIEVTIERENSSIGGWEAERVFVQADSEIRRFIANDVIVFRDGVEMTELRSTRDPAAMNHLRAA
jgi:hypothetical protein